MEELATCHHCKKQLWKIFMDRVECDSCGDKIYFREIESAYELTEHINEIKEA